MVVPLIAGAGPSGLAAALLMARQGVKTRIIDKAAAPASSSRALAVNPRTLDLMEESGITADLLARGLKIRTVCFWQDGRALAQIALDGLQHRYPFLLALSQAATEKVLTEALLKAGGEVERGTTLTACSNTPQGVQATLDKGGASDTVLSPWLLGADGAHSTARTQLQLGFDGSSLPELWYLADMALHTDLQPDAVHIQFLSDGGFIFLLRVIDDIRITGDAPLWRVMGNFPDPLSRLTNARAAAAPVWQSSFHIGHRIASALQIGHIFLAGDAAHIHSPMGARGMNLGIEDAYSFARLAAMGRLADYGALRRRIDCRVVKRVEAFTLMARGQSTLTRLLRQTMPRLALHFGPAYSQLVGTAAGLDHEVEL